MHNQLIQPYILLFFFYEKTQPVMWSGIQRLWPKATPFQFTNVLISQKPYRSTPLNTFAAKYLKNPTPQCQACYKDSWILRAYRFNTEYLQKHSTNCCVSLTECCKYINYYIFCTNKEKNRQALLAAILEAILKIKKYLYDYFCSKIDKTIHLHQVINIMLNSDSIVLSKI